MRFHCRFIAVAALVATATFGEVLTEEALAEEALAETVQQRGEVIARGLCSPCHAIGRTDASKHVEAPRFRTLDGLTNLSKLSQRLQGGLLTGHEGMPLYRFSRDDADAMVAYIRSIQDR